MQKTRHQNSLSVPDCRWWSLSLVIIAVGDHCHWWLLQVEIIAIGDFYRWWSLPLMIMVIGDHCHWWLLPLVIIAIDDYGGWRLLPLVICTVIEKRKMANFKQTINTLSKLSKRKAVHLIRKYLITFIWVGHLR